MTRRLLLIAIVFCLSGAAIAQEQDRLIYRKVFKGSTPEYQAVILERNGAGKYLEAADDPNPVEFQLPAKAAEEMFSLAASLDYFANKLEADLPIAKMGEKTFRYEGSHQGEQTFNYSTDLNAQKLLANFEKIAESQRLFIRLEYSLKFDRLGINDSLLAIDSALTRDRLMGTDHFLPLLDAVVKSKRYMNISRNRADAIARALRAANGSGEQ